ncbi:hypothetical protein G3V76_23990, partial [Escherichia coli]|nr:hypothetical protein [Escherichia coli]
DMGLLCNLGRRRLIDGPGCTAPVTRKHERLDYGKFAAAGVDRPERILHAVRSPSVWARFVGVIAMRNGCDEWFDQIAAAVAIRRRCRFIDGVGTDFPIAVAVAIQNERLDQNRSSAALVIFVAGAAGRDRRERLSRAPRAALT